MKTIQNKNDFIPFPFSIVISSLSTASTATVNFPNRFCSLRFADIKFLICSCVIRPQLAQFRICKAGSRNEFQRDTKAFWNCTIKVWTIRIVSVVTFCINFSTGYNTWHRFVARLTYKDVYVIVGCEAIFFMNIQLEISLIGTNRNGIW